MNLYRMFYLREEQLKAITFTAATGDHAWQIAQKWTSSFEGKLLVVHFLRPLHIQLELAA